MNGPDEREALDPAPSLYAYALRRVRESPEDEVPFGAGFDLPDGLASDDPPFSSWDEAWMVVRDALTPLPDDPDILRRRFAEFGIGTTHANAIRAVVTELPLSAEQEAAARTLGRCLAYTGTDPTSVATGMALLGRLGGPEDVACLRVLARIDDLGRAAVEALDALDRPTAALTWLARRIRRAPPRSLVRALWSGDEAAVRTELLAFPTRPPLVGGAIARRVAEAARLPELLDRHAGDPELLARAGRLLARMGDNHHDSVGLLTYRDAVALYETVVAGADRLSPTVEHYAVLLSLALDLSSGPGVLLDWPAGRREALSESLGRLLATRRWAAVADTAVDDADPVLRLRVEWIRRFGRRPFAVPGTRAGLRVEVVWTDPVDREAVETRILLDGRPLVPEAFGRGAANGPEYLLDVGRLRAEAEPHEVQLAQAWCTEGCCGALYVTIHREGDEVVWRDWRRPGMAPGSREPLPELPAYRFDAAAYDAEIERAEADDAWSWPACTVARMIAAGVRARPELLTRWDVRPGWISTDFEDPTTAVVTFLYGRGEGFPLQFLWKVPDDGRPPEAQADAALRRLAEEDPKGYGRVSGGSRERAEELGYPWPDDG
ncbi:hypothetical protein [Embleya sp. MST-111070]|uniref:hypothetical protein n=1 Tax=Embleya sp. MST-111070 TaxID=3398231 RepID=UPI003F734BF3